MNRKPLTESIATLLAERDWSLRELSRQTRRRGDGIGPAALSAVMRGDLNPSMAALESIAKALGIRPEHFPEYRLDAKRAELDWRRHGVKRALKALGE